MAGSPGPRIARLLATKRTRSSWRACEPATHHCWKPTPISSTPPQTPSVPFAKRSRRRSNTGYGGPPGSMQQGKTYFEVLLHPSMSLPPTLKSCWRSQGSPSGRPSTLKPQQQQQQRHQHTAMLLVILLCKAEKCLWLMDDKRLHLAMSSLLMERRRRLWASLAIWSASGIHPVKFQRKRALLWSVEHVIFYIGLANGVAGGWKRHQVRFFAASSRIKR